MAALVWAMIAIALWHFTVFLPDRFWQGIVGAFISAIIGAMIFGFLVNGLNVPGESDTTLAQAFIAVPGTAIGLAVCYFIGMRSEGAAEEQS